MPFKRKTYSSTAKPVKQPKPKAPEKPSVMELNKLCRRLSLASNNQHIDVLAKVLYWWQDALAYARFKDPLMKVQPSRGILDALAYIRKGQAAKKNVDKEKAFVSAIELFRKSLLVYFPNVVSIVPYIKQYHTSHKKVDEQVRKIAPRFDPFLTMLSAALGACPFTLQVVPTLNRSNAPARQFDHALNTMMYTRSLALKLMKQYRQEGLLSVIVDEARHISRVMSFNPDALKEGAFIPDAERQLRSYMALMVGFVEYARKHPEAPKRLVKNVPQEQKRKAKAASKKITFDDLAGGSVVDQLLDTMQNKA